MKLTVFSLLFAGSMAACPNACSQHGECGEFDSCDCHAGFQGGDCSERVCMYNWAWVTTANGDLNFDGDRYDGTVYSTTTKIEASIADTPTVGYGGQVLLTQAAPGGTWESWPYYGTAEEGHYYMECSNRGLCDRATGDCQCFDGYTGTACNRMVCPEDCSEHGICQTVKDYDSTYKLWDRNMARSCKCDAGYTGPACQTRECPFGDDPLTKDNELYETQYVDFFSTCEGSTSTDCGSGTQLGGYGRLTYTDHHGESYTTNPFPVLSYEGTDTTVSTAAAAALKALPNNVISDSITVTPQYCETTVDDAVAITAVGVVTGPTTPVRILDAGALDAVTTRVVIDGSDGSVIVTSSGGVAKGTALAGLTAGNYHVSSVPNPNCIRLKIDFVGMPGNLNALVADHSLVEYNGETNAQDGATKARVSSSVTSAQQITGGGTASLSIGYTRPSTVKYEGSGNGQITLPGTITYGSAVLFQGVTTAFHPNSRIKIECKTVTSGVANSWRNLGIYTVAAATADLPTDTILKVQETIVANDCTAASSSIRITMVSNVITVASHDLTKTPSIAAGDRVKMTLSGVDTTFGTTIKSIEYHSGVTVTNGVKGFIILNEEFADAASADVTAATGSLFHHADGTRENVACSDRGLCQEDGTCKCFPGYTGDSCSIQKSIST